ncbi:hypothetical protein FOZ60_004793 [Perkinsus olseni]|uniref:Uncharacterized protein n=1 Tax=Perkinsus olseni TaxID=32597 RepID=A0A7J6NUP8_PEROL|nr:hypothetical protein FOZ60_004793 [Perkinsus olseni]
MERLLAWFPSGLALPSWQAARLRWSLKAHILSDHVEEYLETYESVIGGGLGLSSEPSSESLHSRVQRLWNLRFNVDTENSRFADRLVDCMVTYNWNLDWDGASRATPDDDTMLCSDSEGSVRASNPAEEDAGYFSVELDSDKESNAS